MYDAGAVIGVEGQESTPWGGGREEGGLMQEGYGSEREAGGGGITR